MCVHKDGALVAAGPLRVAPFGLDDERPRMLPSCQGLESGRPRRLACVVVTFERSSEEGAWGLVYLCKATMRLRYVKSISCSIGRAGH